MTDFDNKNYGLREAIVKAVAFFDMFDYPLTLDEIWRYLGVKAELAEVMEELENMEKSSSIVISTSAREEKSLECDDGKYKGFLPAVEMTKKDGFYFLAGREAIVKQRLGRYNFAGRKFKRALLMAKIFKFIPWIKLIAVGNLMGAQNMKDESDIDFFIIAEPKKIWLARFFCAGLAKVLGLRPGPGGTRDKICLSFFVSEDKLDLKGLMIKTPLTPPPRLAAGETGLLEGGQIQDIYFIYWLAGLTPIYDTGGIYDKFIAANGWLNGCLPNWRKRIWSDHRDAGQPWQKFYHDAVDLFFGGLEPQFRRYQIKIMPPALKSLMNLDSRAVADEGVIKLHANDRREEYRKKLEEKIKLLK